MLRKAGIERDIVFTRGTNAENAIGLEHTGVTPDR